MRPESLLILIFVGLLGATAGGLTLYTLTASPEEPLPTFRTVHLTPERDPELLTEIRALRREVSELQTRLTILETRDGSLAKASTPPPSEPDEEEPAREEDGPEIDALLDQLRNEVQDQMRALEARQLDPPEFKTRVADAMAAIRKEQAVEYYRGAEQEHEARMEERLTRLTERLDLNPRQVDELRGVFTLEHDRNLEVIQLWEEGADDELLGETKTANHEEHEAALAEILTAEQLAAYREAQAEEEEEREEKK